ncbi:MAG: DNA-binding protein WhiA [Lachnospiraceae bacterium]|nr:DNA-binding protein WhiA [Lachnospiraceae bacterium]
MSFSSEVKEELFHHIGKSRHCQIAEMAAIMAWESDNPLTDEKKYILFQHLCDTESLEGSSMQKMYEAVKMWDHEAGIPILRDTVDGILIQQNCCKRAYIRGAFLAAGSISDPEKSYHFEVVCRTHEQAEQLREVINTFAMDAKIVERKKHFVVYLKEGSQIVDILNVMEAHVALMNLENVRILKEMRNSVNRKVNCETANISKTVNAAVKQLEDIIYVRDTIGFETLPDNLREIAELRLEYPEAPLKELGTYLNPPVGKSGVNHRLRKISTLAEAERGRIK